MTSVASLRPEPRPEILAIDVYVPGKSRVRASRRSTSCRRTSRRSDRRRKRSRPFQAAADDLALYPDGSARALREAIGRRFGLDPERILCGNGSDEILAAAGACLSAAGRRGALQRARVSRISDRHSRGGRDAGRRAGDGPDGDVDALLARVGPRTKIVYLANPNNPTGTYLPFRRSSGCTPGCRRIASSCSTRPTPNM